MIPEMEGLLFWEENNHFSGKDTFIKEIGQSAVCMVCAAIEKRNKISEIIETYPETLQKKAEYSEGLSS